MMLGTGEIVMNVYNNEYDDNIKSIEIELNKLVREEVL